MQYPKIKQEQIPAPNTELDWNTLGAQDYVVVSKAVLGDTRHFFGQVVLLEKLRNCHMLHFEVWECWSEGVDGREYDDSQLNNMATSIKGTDVPCSVKWKKPKGSIVRTWNPNIQLSYVSPVHSSRASRFGGPARKMPSDRTAEFLGTPNGSELDEMLKSRAGKRQAYVAARALMTVFRDEMAEAFELIGLDYTSTMDDFKNAQRNIMKQWHPDREAIFVKEGGSKEAFKSESTKWMAALAKVKHAITPKQTTTLVEA